MEEMICTHPLHLQASISAGEAEDILFVGALCLILGF